MGSFNTRARTTLYLGNTRPRPDPLLICQYQELTRFRQGLILAPRLAFRAVRQCSIPNRSAIHDQVIVVSVRRRIAIRTFLGSPLRRRRPNSDSVQPALR